MKSKLYANNLKASWNVGALLMMGVCIILEIFFLVEHMDLVILYNHSLLHGLYELLHLI
jgi:hypothetical protein